LPIEKVLAGVETVTAALGNTPEHGHDAAVAIMTTDTTEKIAFAEIEIGGKSVKLAGMAKGSGMIHPNMATMLGVITTDAAIERGALQNALKTAADRTFNMISVDGDTSTNDTLLVLANGAAGNAEITLNDCDALYKFTEALIGVTEKLAKLVARDGEGATKLIEVDVTGADTCENAAKLAKAVCSSSLFKAAMFGADANWGRALCAMGYSGVKFDPEGVSIAFRSAAGVIDVYVNGKPIVFDEDSAKKVLSEEFVFVDIKAGEGEGNAAAWGCDLTYEYVKINGDYRS
jgi:glutamate N-acetyltransferase/amino-acid N-acetyltransferase